MLLPFRRGFERIMKDVEAPIVPVHLDGVWGSIFSFEKGRFLWKLPPRIPYPVTVSFGAPMPHERLRRSAPAGRAGARQRRLGGAQAPHDDLHRGFVRAARRRPFRFAMADRACRSSARAARSSGRSSSRGASRRTGAASPWSGSCSRPRCPARVANFAALLSARSPST
jgi:acyl-[acyl-carrier-protein]-phospholipid O-acyltransferase/long-chain-fatty-acid--[acyl-carrier-protein] ligase